MHVEAAILIDDPPQGGVELLGQAGIESGFPHIDEIAADGRGMQPVFDVPTVPNPRRIKGAGMPREPGGLQEGLLPALL